MRRQQSTPVTSPQPTSHRGRRIACRQCRQAKIRCDLSSGGTTPCSRCHQAGHECVIATDFKRVNKRARLEELEDEVRQLRSSVSSHLISTPPQQATGGSSMKERSGNASERLSGLGDYSSLNQPVFMALSPPTLGRELYPGQASNVAISPRSLVNVRLNIEQIHALFNLFFSRFHPFVALLDASCSPDRYFEQSPLLFWAIIYVASRQYSEEPSLSVTLAPAVKRLLWETIPNPPHSWHTVQAMLLICLWPFPTTSLSTDTTSTLASIAQTLAMQLGLDQPESIQDFCRTKIKLNQTEVSEAVRTWSVCYIASQGISSTHGMLPVSSNGMVDRICDEHNVYDIPMGLRHQLLIARFSARTSRYMSESLHSTRERNRSCDTSSMLGLLEQEYTDLCRGLNETLTAENKILLIGAELQLHVFYLLDTGESLARKVGLLRAFDSAKSLLNDLQQLDATASIIKYSPSSYFRITTLAAMFILRLQDSSFAGLLDLEGGKRAFNAALKILRRASLEDNDLPGRTSKILAELWSIQGRSRQSGEEPRLRLRTRLAASLLHDQLWSWRETFGDQQSNADTPPDDTQDTNPLEGLLLVPETSASVVSDLAMDRFPFEEIFDMELMTLLPFDLGNDVPSPRYLG